MPRTKHRDIADNFIFDDTVTTADLQNGSVTSTKLAEGAIDSAGKIGDNAITTAKIADNNITTAKILAGNITSSKLAEGVIDSAGKLADNVVTSAKILDGSISSTKIAASAIDSAGLLSDNVITTAKILAGSISSTKIAAGAIDSAGLVADDAITGAKLADDITIGNNLTVTGTTSIAEAIEKATIDNSTTGTINFDALTQAVIFYDTSQTANRTVNFRGDGTTTLDSVMAVGESMTFALLMTEGATPYYLNTYQVDGSAVTPKWQGGSAPTSGNASSVDAYTFTTLKTASATFSVFASQTQYA